MQEKNKIPLNVILVGEKPFMAYMKSVNTLFRGKNLREIEIRARGRNIKKAIDIAESSKRKFCHDLKLNTKSVLIGTEEFTAQDRETQENKQVSVSVITIILNKS